LLACVSFRIEGSLALSLVAIAVTLLVRGEVLARGIRIPALAWAERATLVVSGVGFTLFCVLLALFRERLSEITNFRQSVDEASRRLVKESLREVRRVIQAIRPKESSKPVGLRSISQLVRTLEKATRIKAALHFTDAPGSFGEEQDIVVYRLVQEGITNAIRHGNAKNIGVYFTSERGGIRVEVQDDGVGFTDFTEGFGINDMLCGDSLQL
jgi:signal transduction histidine kinase